MISIIRCDDIVPFLKVLVTNSVLSVLSISMCFIDSIVFSGSNTILTKLHICGVSSNQTLIAGQPELFTASPYVLVCVIPSAY